MLAPIKFIDFTSVTGLSVSDRSLVFERFDQNGESLYEELASAIIHGAAAVLAAAGLALLIVLASGSENTWTTVAVAVYGATLVLTFLASALYHGTWHRQTKAVFLLFDHCAIFLLIAGTYTPLTVLAVPKPLGWFLFASIWALALLGIGARLWFGHLHWSLIPLFLAMGWLGFAWSGTIFAAVGPVCGWLLVAGGLAYTGGVVFYLWRSLPFNHALWHLCVVAGGVCHFVAIARFIILPAT